MKGDPATTEHVVVLFAASVNAQFVFATPGPRPVNTKSRDVPANVKKSLKGKGFAEFRSKTLPTAFVPSVPPEYVRDVPIPVSMQPVLGNVPVGEKTIVVSVTVTPPPGGQLASLNVPITEAEAGVIKLTHASIERERSERVPTGFNAVSILVIGFESRRIYLGPPS